MKIVMPPLTRRNSSAFGTTIWLDLAPSRRRTASCRREDAHSVDQVIGEQRVDEFDTALGDEVRVGCFRRFHVDDVAQED